MIKPTISNLACACRSRAELSAGSETDCALLFFLARSRLDRPAYHSTVALKFTTAPTHVRITLAVRCISSMIFAKFQQLSTLSAVERCSVPSPGRG